MMSARELGILARHIIRTYPEFYKIFGEREFTWNKIRQFKPQSAAVDDGRRRRFQDRHDEEGALRHGRLRAAQQHAPDCRRQRHGRSR